MNKLPILVRFATWFISTALWCLLFRFGWFLFLLLIIRLLPNVFILFENSIFIHNLFAVWFWIIFSPFMSRTNSTLHTTEKEWENETTKKPRQNDYVIHVQRSVDQEEALTKYCSFDNAKKDAWKDDNWWRQSSSIFFSL